MSYWAVHGSVGGFFFLFFLLLLPRTTLLLSVSWVGALAVWMTEPLGSVLGSVLYVPLLVVLGIASFAAWVAVPRWLIAILATVYYAETNLVLVVEAWVLAYIFFELQKEAVKNTVAAAKQKAAERRQAGGTQKWWQVLDVSPSASAEAIKAAFRKKAKMFHPDSGQETADPQKFAEIKDAYEKAKKK